MAWHRIASYVSGRDTVPARHDPPEATRRSPRRCTKGTAPGMGPATLFQMSVLHEGADTARRSAAIASDMARVLECCRLGARSASSDTPNLSRSQGAHDASCRSPPSASYASLALTRDGGAAFLPPAALAVWPNAAIASAGRGPQPIYRTYGVRGTASPGSLHDGEEAFPWPALAPAIGPTG